MFQTRNNCKHPKDYAHKSHSPLKLQNSINSAYLIRTSLRIRIYYKSFDHQCPSFNINVTKNVKINDLQYLEFAQQSL